MSGKILVGEHDGVHVVRFEGDVRVTLAGNLDHYVADMLAREDFVSVVVDLSRATGLDSTSLGGLAKLSIQVKAQQAQIPTLICQSEDILRVLDNMGFDDVFVIVDEAFVLQSELAEIPSGHEMSVAEMRTAVIDAHKTLMSMNTANAETFRDLVRALEDEKREDELRSSAEKPAVKLQAIP